VADLNTAPAEAYSRQFKCAVMPESCTGAFAIQTEYQPFIVLPTDLRNHKPEWEAADCTGDKAAYSMRIVALATDSATDCGKRDVLKKRVVLVWRVLRWKGGFPGFGSRHSSSLFCRSSLIRVMLSRSFRRDREPTVGDLMALLPSPSSIHSIREAAECFPMLSI
jgi:hypothetical protein